ncbi:MAG TPA: VanZ family protein [Fimbriimonadaceae bacterium]|nr:VanZ family protein [Fimbriimonadaceae bacterium]
MRQTAIKGVVLTVLFGGLIWASSKTVITVDQLANAVCSVVPIHKDTFKQVWEQVWWLFVKGWHATEFGILVWLLSWVLGRFRWGLEFASGIAVGFAFLDEWHQTSVASRGGRLSDVAIDCIGILTAALLITGRRKQKLLSRRSLLLGGLLILGAIGLLSLHPFGDLSRRL